MNLKDPLRTYFGLRALFFHFCRRRTSAKHRMREITEDFFSMEAWTREIKLPLTVCVCAALETAFFHTFPILFSCILGSGTWIWARLVLVTSKSIRSEMVKWYVGQRFWQQSKSKVIPEKCRKEYTLIEFGPHGDYLYLVETTETVPGNPRCLTRDTPKERKRKNQESRL